MNIVLSSAKGVNPDEMQHHLSLNCLSKHPLMGVEYARVNNRLAAEEIFVFMLSCGLMCSNNRLYRIVARKPVFGVSDKASFKAVSSATETS